MPKSPFSGHTAVVDYYSEWTVELGFPAGTPDTRKAFLAWRDSLQGALGTFLYRPHGSGRNVTGKSLTSGAFAYSNEIEVGGWTGTESTGLSVGDYLSISNKLFRITSVPSTTTLGKCIISIEPSLKVDFIAGTAVNFQTPTVVLRQVIEEVDFGYSRDVNAVYIDTVRAVEAL